MRIVILAPPGVQSLDVVGPAEVFWEAARRLGRPDAYEVKVMGASNAPIAGTGSLRFLPDCTIDDPDEEIDTLLVGGDPSFQEIDPKVVDWIRRRAPGIRRYGSVCTGVFLLAAAPGRSAPAGRWPRGGGSWTAAGSGPTGFAPKNSRPTIPRSSSTATRSSFATARCARPRASPPAWTSRSRWSRRITAATSR